MTKIRQICAWVSLATIGLGALASYSSILRRQPIPGDLNNPILAVEIMHAPSDLYGIVGDQKDPRRTALRRLTEFDCGFIAAYATLFVCVGCCMRQKAKWTGWSVMLCGLAELSASGITQKRPYKVS